MSEPKPLSIDPENLGIPNHEGAKQLIEGLRQQLQKQNPAGFEALVQLEQAILTPDSPELEVIEKNAYESGVPALLIHNAWLSSEEYPADAAFSVIREDFMTQGKPLSLTDRYVLAVAYGVDPNEPF